MRLKDVRPVDMWFLHKLNVHPSIRAMCHNQASFTYERHCEWWKTKLIEKGFDAMVITHRSKPVGCIRRDRGFVSISVMPEYQNQGIGTKALKAFCMKDDRAEILLDNKKSIHIFKKVGFKDGFLTLLRG